ncbi:transmembrane protein 151B-like isoform X1 [Ostrea edulis]|uniref:transmembrane protein 151B-like isoform X1 n=1 Tax=Ostrea edulis TaxID=37623 RepID=UPI0020952DA1|nr:transmembrane protein 151B-like isoform X1 [Ostrea edulis]
MISRGNREDQTPIKQSFCASLRRDAHWKCMILTLLIYGCLSAIIWCRLAVITTITVSYYGHRMANTHVSKSKPCEDGYIYIPIAFVIMLYLVYLVECWHSHTRLELKHKTDVNAVYEKIQQMQESIPIIWWKALCYHYIRKTRHVTRYRNGDSFTSTQVYYERVNSHTAGSAFNFTQCGIKDVSASLTGLENFPATKIRFTKGYSFLCSEAEYEFDEQRNRFYRDNERRDDYIETREGMDLLNVNFKQYMIAFRDPDNLPWYVSHVIFWVASFLLLSWPLRVIIEYKTAYVHYHVHKIFGSNYLENDIESTPMTRVNTMGSSDLEVVLQNNHIAPSYSEALLMSSGRTIGIADANGNVTRTKYGATRSETFAALSSVADNKDSIRRIRSGTALNFSPCNSFCIVNGGVVFENNHMQNDSYANSRRKETRRSFVFSRQNEFHSSLNSPTDPLVYVNPSCDTARLLRPNSEAERCHNHDPLLYHNNYVGITPAPTRNYRCSEDTNTRHVIPGDPPPDYQQALVMQRPKTVPKGSQQPSLPLPSTRIVIEENAYLQSVPNRRNYHTMMETSL